MSFPPARFNGPCICTIIKQQILGCRHFAKVGAFVGDCGAPCALYPAVINQLPHQLTIADNFSYGHSQRLVLALFLLLRSMRIVRNKSIGTHDIAVCAWVFQLRARQPRCPQTKFFTRKMFAKEQVYMAKLWVEQGFSADNTDFFGPMA